MRCHPKITRGAVTSLREFPDTHSIVPTYVGLQGCFRKAAKSGEEDGEVGWLVGCMMAIIIYTSRFDPP